MPASTKFRLTLTLVLFCGLQCAAQTAAAAPQRTLLWPDGAPGARGSAPEDQPSLTLYLPDKPPTAAVVICPGGGYSHLAVDKEGTRIARLLNSFGLAAFVLEYRLGPAYRYPAPFDDASRAMRYARSRAREFHIARDKIGIMGFSAGGHLASTVGTHFDEGDATSADPIERESNRPDFMVLIYPVIKPAGKAAASSFGFLLGEHPDPALTQRLSNDSQVTAKTPPTFLVHADDDRAVLPENSVAFYLALKQAGVAAELHVYRAGGHGFGLAVDKPALATWTSHLAEWLSAQGLANQ
jgi:acetyl esterase/lipase